MEAFRKAIADTRKGYVLACERLSMQEIESRVVELNVPTTPEVRRVEILAYLLDAASPVTTYGSVHGVDPTRKNIIEALPDTEFASKYKAIWDADGVRVYNKGNSCVFIDPTATCETVENDGQLMWKDKPRGKWKAATDEVGKTTVESMLGVVNIFKQRDFTDYTTQLGVVRKVTIIAGEVAHPVKFKEYTLRRLFFMDNNSVAQHVFNTAGLRAIHLWFGKPVEELTCHLITANRGEQPTVALLVTDGTTTASLASMIVD